MHRYRPHALALLTAAAVAATGTPAGATQVIGTGVYTGFKAMHSGRCLDNNGSMADQTPVVQKQCVPGLNQQLWSVVSGSGNTIQMRNAHSGKCLDVPASMASGTPLVQHQCHGGTNQQWLVVPANASVANGAVKLFSVYSNKCADVFAFNLNDGAPVVQWDCLVGFNNQDFIPQ